MHQRCQHVRSKAPDGSLHRMASHGPSRNLPLARPPPLIHSVSRPESAGHDTAALHRVAAGNLQSAGPALVGVKEGFIAKSLGGTKLSTQAFNAGPFGGR